MILIVVCMLNKFKISNLVLLRKEPYYLGAILLLKEILGPFFQVSLPRPRFDHRSEGFHRPARAKTYPTSSDLLKQTSAHSSGISGSTGDPDADEYPPSEDAPPQDEQVL